MIGEVIPKAIEDLSLKAKIELINTVLGKQITATEEANIVKSLLVDAVRCLRKGGRLEEMVLRLQPSPKLSISDYPKSS